MRCGLSTKSCTFHGPRGYWARARYVYFEEGRDGARRHTSPSCVRRLRTHDQSWAKRGFAEKRVVEEQADGLRLLTVVGGQGAPP